MIISDLNYVQSVNESDIQGGIALAFGSSNSSVVLGTAVGTSFAAAQDGPLFFDAATTANSSFATGFLASSFNSSFAFAN